MNLPILRRYFMLASGVLLGMGLLLAACAPGGPRVVRCNLHGREYVELFSEHFGTALPDDWSFDGKWEIVEIDENSAVHIEGMGAAVYKPGSWGEQPFIYSFKILKLVRGFSANFLDSAEGGNYPLYSLVVKEGPGYVDEAPIGLILSLQKLSPTSAPQVLATSDNLGYDSNKTYQIDIDYDRGKIQVYYYPDDPSTSQIQQPVLVANDPAPITSGTISYLTQKGTTLLLDDIQICGQPYVLSGTVYDLAGKPLPGIRVRVYGSDRSYSEDPNRVEELNSEATDQQGTFKVEAPPGYSYYLLHVEDQPGYKVYKAESAYGEIYDGTWIEHKSPLDGTTSTNNIFYLEEIPTETVSTTQPTVHEEPAATEIIEEPAATEVVVTQIVEEPAATEVVVTQIVEEPAATEVVVTKIIEEPAATEIVVTKIVEEPTVTEIIVTQIVEEPVTAEVVEDTATPLPSDTATPEPSDTPTLKASNTPTSEPSNTPLPEPTETDAGEAILTMTHIAPSPSPTRITILPPDFGRWMPILLGLALLAAGTIVGVGLVAYLLFRGTPPGGAGQPPDRPPRQPTPLPPFLPPVRLMDVWLSEGGSGRGRVLQPGNTLIVGREYSLHVQLRLRGERRRRPRGYPREDIALNVVLFAPQTDFAIPERTGRISLPVDASSETFIRPLRPQRSGRLQVRACVYYGNLLLQSAVLEAPVGRREVGRLTRRIDYVASGTFSRLGFLSQPSLSLFTNQAPDGTHWLGIFSANTPSGSLLRQGDLQQFPADYLSSRAERARQSLSRIQGEEVYRLKNNLPLDERALQVHARDLVDLARQGTLLYNDLFGCDPDGSRGRARVTALRQLLQEPGLVSIARCRRDSLSMPWGMLYSLPLRVEPDIPLQVCPIYLQHLRANEWIPGQEQLSYQSDRLDDPPGCLSQNDCPRQGSEAYQTVCPFGFLGLTHQIEQPIQLIEPFPTDQTPPKLIEQRLDTNTRILRKTGEAVRVGLGAYAGFRALPRHRQALEALSPVLKLEYAEDREQVWKLLQKGDQHFFYFFCHGVVDQNNTFQLMIGQPDRPGFISASSLTPPIIQWPAEPRPLVVLNGCETAALKAELLGVFMDNLRFVGALGVVGTEIKVKTELAFAFGLPWMRALLSGQPAGQAMLNVRRHLERQGNPLGLAYSLYAPAGLHLHDQSGCAACMVFETVS